MTAPTQPSDMPGPARPVPVQPGPASINIHPVDATGPTGTVHLVAVELYTSSGSAFAFFEPGQVEKVFADAVRICAAQRAGLVVPINGIIRPGGPG